MQKVAPHFLNNLFERPIMWLLKTNGLFEKKSNHLQRQAVKTSKEVAETTSTGLRTVQTIIKNWKDGREPSYLEKKYVFKKSWLITIGDFLNIWQQILKKKQQ